MIAEIIPYAKLPRNLDVFDYKINDELAAECPPGQIVYIPFRRQKILGVIKRYKERSEFPKLREITERTDYQLSEKQLELIFDLASYYINSPSLILREMLATIPKKKHEVKIKWQDIYNWQFDEKALLNLENINAVKKEITNEFRRYLIFSNSQKRRWALYWTYLNDYIKRGKKQLMIIFPNINDIEAFLRFVSKEYSDEICILTSKIHQKKTLFFNEWLKIKENKTKVILGSRSALFAPLDNVETIIIDKAEAREYKQDEPNPRYHAVDLAYLSQKRYKFRLILNSLSPRFLDYFLSKEKDDYSIINDYQSVKNTSHWINMKNDPFNSERPAVLSEEAEELCLEAKEKDEKVLILHNKQSQDKETYCQSCHKVLNCSDCKIALSYNEEKRLHYCHNCHKEEKVVFCPECKSKDLHHYSYGVKDIAKYLKGKGLSCLTIEHNYYSQEKIKKIAEHIKNSSSSQAIVATNQLLNYLDFKDFNKVIITNSDRLLYSNDFNANWHSFNYYNELIQKAAEDNFQLYLQTYNIEHFVFQSLKSQKFHDFYQNEIKWRKKLSYPPFKQLIKLIYQNENINEGEKVVKTYYKKLKLELKGNLRIAFPYPIYKSLVKRQNKKTYRWIIAIRSEYSSLKPNTDLYKMLENLGTEWLIDINPENLYK